MIRITEGPMCPYVPSVAITPLHGITGREVLVPEFYTNWFESTLRVVTRDASRFFL